MEATLKKEIYDLGYEIKNVEDGRVTFEGDDEAICRSNICLRTAQRVLLCVGSGIARTFDELFELTKSFPWERYIPKDGKFWVKKASSVKSTLFSPSDIQSIVKKAIVERLKGRYHISWFEENGSPYPIRVFIHKDKAYFTLDTSGESLHKRGYRTSAGAAPISECLAAGLIYLTPWKGDRILVDPFCGSGTIPIEAAMIAANIPPGLNRDFTACSWKNIIPANLWKEIKSEASGEINTDIKTDIQGYDLDFRVLKTARENAKRAGVENLIHFQERDAKDLSHHKKYGFVITNPPYGERIEDKENLAGLYADFGKAMERLDDWSVYIITAYELAEKYIGKKATKNRKIYNGMIKTYYYQYIGAKPPKKKIKGN